MIARRSEATIMGFQRICRLLFICRCIPDFRLVVECRRDNSRLILDKQGRPDGFPMTIEDSTTGTRQGIPNTRRLRVCSKSGSLRKMNHGTQTIPFGPDRAPVGDPATADPTAPARRPAPQ